MAHGIDAGGSVASARAALTAEFKAHGIAEPAADARLLIAYALEIEPARLGIEAARKLTADEAARLKRLAGERLAGRTVGRIVGHRAFHDIVLETADDVLEPRDDTAALVDLSLRLLGNVEAPRVWDVGVGAGTVALAILHARKDATAIGTDVSAAALVLTERNADALGVRDRLELECVNGLDRRMGAFDLIVSNPPYIRTGDIQGLGAEARVDPVLALDGGTDGLSFYRLLADRAAAHLAPGGVVAVEIGHDQGADVRGAFADRGWIVRDGECDLGGHERALAFSRPAPEASRGPGGDNRAGVRA